MKEVKLIAEKKQAKLWKRVAAYGIDMLIINIIVLYPFKEILKKYETNTAILSGINYDSTLIILTFTVAVLALAYWVLFEHLIQQSIGKMLFNLYVVSATKAKTKLAKKPSLAQIVTRNVIKPFSLVLLIDVLYMIIKKKNQRLFEVFSNTKVIEIIWRVK